MREAADTALTATPGKHMPALGKGPGPGLGPQGRILEQQLQRLCVSLLQVLKRKNARRALLVARRNSHSSGASSAFNNANHNSGSSVLNSSRSNSSAQHPPSSAAAMSGKQGGKAKPLKASKKDVKEYDEADIAHMQKKKDEEKALKDLKSKAAGKGAFGGAGLKKSGGKK